MHRNAPDEANRRAAGRTAVRTAESMVVPFYGTEAGAGGTADGPFSVKNKSKGFYCFDPLMRLLLFRYRFFRYILCHRAFNGRKPDKNLAPTRFATG